MKAWVFLLLAIVSEVAGTSALKFFAHEAFLSYGVMAGLIGVSYYCMALACVRIPVGVAYAMWEVLGVICIVLVGVVGFGEVLSLYQKLGLALGIGGIILINLGGGE